LLIKAAEAPICYLQELVRAAFSRVTPAVDAARLVPLLGLGPGLTPSGDDVLGGALVALHLLGLDDLRDRIWSVLRPAAWSRTNEISRAHLAAAAAGYGSAALHALLADVITGNATALEAKIATVAATGHSSGWDALAGAMVVLRAAAAR